MTAIQRVQIKLYHRLSLAARWQRSLLALPFSSGCWTWSTPSLGNDKSSYEVVKWDLLRPEQRAIKVMKGQTRHTCVIIINHGWLGYLLMLIGLWLYIFRSQLRCRSPKSTRNTAGWVVAADWSQIGNLMIIGIDAFIRLMPTRQAGTNAALIRLRTPVPDLRTEAVIMDSSILPW